MTHAVRAGSASAPAETAIGGGKTRQRLKSKALNLTVALSYGSQQEIVAAAKRLAQRAAAGTLDPEDLNEERFASELMTADIPDPDLLIRTSGEQRLSDFMLWECAYAELHFTDRKWPDFSETDLERALDEFHGRERRFGGLPSAPVIGQQVQEAASCAYS